MKTDFPRLKAALANSIWAIEPGKLDALLESLDYVPPGAELENLGNSPDIRIAYCISEGEDNWAKVETLERMKPNTSGAIAILPLYGIITQRASWLSMLFGGTSTEQFGDVLEAAVGDKRIGAIVIDVDSPGGSVYGVQELSERIYNARGKKPIVAVANSFTASAAYWIASAADKVIITPSGQAGSIGVIAVHAEMSKADEKFGMKYTVIKAGEYKAEGNSYEPLSEEAQKYIQGEVDGYYKTFIADVARNRGISTGGVEKKFGQGRMQSAEAAKASGLVDKIATFNEVIDWQSKQLNKQKTRQSAIGQAEKRLELTALTAGLGA